MAGTSADPQHYKRDGVNFQSIDVIRAVLGEAGFRAYCAGNVLKYTWRMFSENRPAAEKCEDAQKTSKYANWLAESWSDQKK